MSVRRATGRLARSDALVLTAAIWFLAKFLRYAFPPLFDSFGASYGVSDAMLGAAFSGLMLAYAAMQFPSGVLADRIGTITVITAGAVVAAAAAIVLVVESSFLVLVGGMLVIGFGTGAHKTVSVRLLARAYPARTGRALGVLDTAGALSGVAAPAAVVGLASLSIGSVAGWRLLFAVAGLVGLVLAAAFRVRVPKRLPDESRGTEPRSSDRGGKIAQYASLFRDWRFSTFALLTVLFSFTYNGVVAFVPRYLTVEAGLSTTTASLLYSGLFLASLVQLVTGYTSDRVGRLPIIVTTLGLASVGLVAFVSLTGTGDPILLGGSLVAVGIGSHGFRPVRGAYLTSAVPDDVAGGGLGIVRTLLMAAGAIAPAVVGTLSETAGFEVAFSLLASSVVGATLLGSLLWAADRD